MTLQPETKEERLRNALQAIQSNLDLLTDALQRPVDIFVLTEIKDALQQAVDAAIEILNGAD